MQQLYGYQIKYFSRATILVTIGADPVVLMDKTFGVCEIFCLQICSKRHLLDLVGNSLCDRQQIFNKKGSIE